MSAVMRPMIGANCPLIWRKTTDWVDVRPLVTGIPLKAINWFQLIYSTHCLQLPKISRVCILTILTTILLNVWLILVEVDVPLYGSERTAIDRNISQTNRLNSREQNSIKRVSQYVDKRLIDNKSVYFCKWEGCSYDTNRSDCIVRYVLLWWALVIIDFRIDRHIHSHTGDKPYKCDQCEYKTVQRSALNQHMVWHTKDKPYKCQMCSYSTIKRNNLEIHIHKNHLTSLIIPNVDNDFKKIGKFVEKKRLNWFECKFGNGCTYGTVRKDAIVRHMKIR